MGASVPTSGRHWQSLRHQGRTLVRGISGIADVIHADGRAALLACLFACFWPIDSRLQLARLRSSPPHLHNRARGRSERGQIMALDSIHGGSRIHSRAKEVKLGCPEDAELTHIGI
jgi:hypothetical protein